MIEIGEVRIDSNYHPIVLFEMISLLLLIYQGPKPWMEILEIFAKIINKS